MHHSAIPTPQSALAIARRHFSAWSATVRAISALGALVMPKRRRDWVLVGVGAVAAHAAAIAIKLVVRRKRPTLGLWLTRRSESFDNVPSYYAVATSRPLREIAPASLLQRLQIGTENLRFRSLGSPSRGDSIRDYEQSIVRLKLRDGLYREDIGAVDFLGPKLFRTEISFPSTAPVGTYQTEVYLVRDERIVAAQSTPLFIDKQGVEQEVYDFSRTEPAVYGLVAVLIAMFSGWLAAVAFRRG